MIHGHTGHHDHCDQHMQELQKDYAWLKWTDTYHLACKKCRWDITVWNDKMYHTHPGNGWWEAYTRNQACACSFYDKMGTRLRNDDPFIATMREKTLNGRRLRIDYIACSDFVKYYDLDDDSYSDDEGPHLRIQDIIASASLSPLRYGIRFFQIVTLPKIRKMRETSVIGQAAPLAGFARFRRCSKSVWIALERRKGEAAWVHAILLVWLPVTRYFSKSQMVSHDPAWANSISHPCIGELIRWDHSPQVEAARGWNRAIFRTPGVHGRSKGGWVHPGIVT